MDAAAGGRLMENITHFARVLRAAGLPIGPGRVIDAVRAVTEVGIERRGDFYWTLHAVFVNRRDQRELFDQAFHMFWRNPKLLERMMALVLPSMRGEEQLAADQELSRRVAEALAANRPGPQADDAGEPPEEMQFEAAMTWSQDEILQHKDFEKMSADEVRAARQEVKRMRLSVHEIATRRHRPGGSGGRPDMRATLRAARRSGSDFIRLMMRRRRTCLPSLVVLCDISGSMDRYARMLIHFLHALTNDRDRVFIFLFGTRLTNVTRHLRGHDVDASLARVGGAVGDWAGGTRIGHCLHAFNREWGRRTLGQGAVVLLITDGLDRDDGSGLAVEAERLHKSCRRLIWLNPLLRYEDFKPKSIGARAIMPHVDEFRPIHNLDSLRALSSVLGGAMARHHGSMARWRELAT